MKSRTDLSTPERELLSLMRGVWFGRLEGLVVAGGRPVLPPAQAVRHLRFGATEPVTALPDAGADFELKKEMVEFLAFLRNLGDGEVKRVDVRYGLPVSAELDGGAVSPEECTDPESLRT